MNITAGAIGNSRLTWVLVLCILLAGIATFVKMPRAYDPGFIIRVAQITTQFPGAGPERVEQLITSPIEDIRKTILSIPGSDNLLYLDDIADVSRGYVDPADSLVHSSGAPALALGVAMREGGNNIQLGEQVRAALAELQPNYPYGIEFDLVNFVPDEVDRKVRDFVVNLLQAIAIVTLVMLVSLGLRTGLVVATLIPLAMLLAIIVMSALGIGLDQISLAALIIALGMLVDNGIVMSESIMVQMEAGKGALAASVDSAAELKLPLLTASLTTAAAFLPIYLAESNVGEFTASLFKVVTITLLSSWVISLTVIPMLGARYLPNLFFPPSDRLYFKVEAELPEGTAIERTEQVVSELERYMQRELVVSESRVAGVTNWVSYVGNAGPKFILSHDPKPSNPSYALMVVNVSDLAQIDPAMEGIRAYAFEHFPDLRLKTRRIENGPAIENPVEVRLSGDDSLALFRAVKALKAHLAEIGGLDAISDDWGRRIKKLEIRIDQPRALRAGVTSQDIAISLQAGLSGVEMTEYREGEDSIPVILRSYASNQQDIGKVEGLSVFVQATGQSVPLTQVANLAVVWEPARIFRRDGGRTVTVGAQLQPGITAAEKFAQLKPWLEQQRDSWGSSVRYEFGGESESSAKANQSIVDKLPVAALIIVLGLLPLYFGGGEMWEPMTIAIMAGLLFSTLLTLGVVPVLYALLYGIRYPKQA